MKLWEAMWLLEENPTNVYEAQLSYHGWTAQMRVSTGPSRYFKFEVFNGAILIDQSHNGGAFNGNVALDLDWRLVRQPVTWQEAIQAWMEGNRVTVEYELFGGVVKHGKLPFGENISVNRNELIQGKWYVED